jgi:hypothetical protein
MDPAFIATSDKRVAKIQKFWATSVRELAGVALHLDCRACRHVTAVDIEDLKRKTGGGYLTLSMLQKRARCASCGARRAAVYVKQIGVSRDWAWMPHPPDGR